MVQPPNDDTAELVALARDGDVRAFSRLMEAQQPRLMGQALAFCGEVQRAQDLVQETMIAAWKSLRRYYSGNRIDGTLLLNPNPNLTLNRFEGRDYD